MNNIKKCATCQKPINNKSKTHHSNIFNNPPLLFFCNENCKQKMMNLMKKHPRTYLELAKALLEVQ